MLLTRIRIVGPSMEPALRTGDWWLVVRTQRVVPGNVILLRHPLRPDLLVVKRVVRADRGGWWVEGDNAQSSDDSRQFGPVSTSDVIGRVWWRYHPLRRGG